MLDRKAAIDIYPLYILIIDRERHTDATRHEEDKKEKGSQLITMADGRMITDRRIN